MREFGQTHNKNMDNFNMTILNLNNTMSLEALDAELQELHTKDERSFTKFKKQVKQMGVCLVNMHSYGSENALKNMLRSKKNLRISLKQAKEFKYVKMCLVVTRGRAHHTRA